MTASSVTRFAPSPTGRLHLGHAHSALFAWAAAGPAGRFLLRIEDIDPQRCRPGFIAGIETDLAWLGGDLGLDWPRPVRRQSDHLPDYGAALDRLRPLLYPCFCTRADIAAEIAASASAPHGPDGALYPGRCRGLDPAAAAAGIASGRPFAWRLDMQRALAGRPALFFTERLHGQGRVRATPEIFGDAVLARKDVPTSYHLAVTIDDALQGVTLVTRGVDLMPATHLHRLLQHLLDLPVPDYHHHPLLTGPDGRRLAKRDHAATLESLRLAGHSPAAVRQMAGFDDPPRG